MIVVTESILNRVFAGRFKARKAIGPRRSLYQPRDMEMIAMYRSGMTLAAVGGHFNLTRQRVEQVLRLHGIGRLDGGQSKQQLIAAHDIVAKMHAEISARERRIFERSGMTLDQWKDHVAEWGSYSTRGSPWRSFKHQLYSAANRGIGWNLTFAQWWQLWQESGKWAERGRGHGYCMARWGDSGAYEIGNIEIIRSSQNSADSYIVRPAKDRKRYTKHELLATHLNVLWLDVQGWGRYHISYILDIPLGRVCRLVAVGAP